MIFRSEDLKRYFGVHRKEAAGFLLLLLSLEPGEVFHSTIGTVEKQEDNTFRIVVDEATLERLCDTWAKDGGDRGEEN